METETATSFYDLINRVITSTDRQVRKWKADAIKLEKKKQAKSKMLASHKTVQQKTATIQQIKQVCKPHNRLNKK